jgi:iron(III) transport system substrate-binding protein
VREEIVNNPESKRIVRRAVLKASLLAVLATAAAGTAMAQSKDDPDYSLLQYQGPDRAQKLLAAAKKEGSLTFYTTIAEKDIPIIVLPFEKKYGIKLNIWRAGTDKVLQRTLSEAAARRYEVDAVHFGSPEMEALHREKILQPVNSPYFKELIPAALPAHREWVATILSVWVQSYNTNIIKKQDLPKTYLDLLDPKWKGKLGIEVKNQEWFSTVAEELGGEAGIKFFRELVAKNGISVRQGHSLLNNMVISGEVPMALTVYNYLAETAKQKGAPIDWFAIEPAVARSNAIGIARHAKHPNAALLFYDYMITEAQKPFASLDYIPTNTNVPSPMKNVRFKLVDPVQVLDQMDKWTKLYQEIVVKRAGP